MTTVLLTPVLSFVMYCIAGYFGAYLAICATNVIK